ncbi:heavy metal-associated isoprenylated plant protein 2-like [Camellia sinensis]|uniref:heavy metal-associated isoprenylated plant protein 2-like n=1 Tax=Camellia sinensis TaxID=4442 RepID=UPI001036068E|nr:heavy metal-associated isoprenylated plant protein 2-like [Camellia sinensis]
MKAISSQCKTWLWLRKISTLTLGTNIVPFTILLCTSMKKIELKVGIYCHKCKTEVLKIKYQWMLKKETLTVIGNVDPVCVTTQVRRKTGKVVELISVGPPKPPDPKPQPCKPPICLLLVVRNASL